MDDKDAALIVIALDALRAVRLGTMNPRHRALWDLAIGRVRQTRADVEADADIRAPRRALD